MSDLKVPPKNWGCQTDPRVRPLKSGYQIHLRSDPQIGAAKLTLGSGPQNRGCYGDSST
ncbi:MAG: hypothetical protein NVS9B4_09170 [Candidatus Acidiferrum sp.]